LVTKNARKRVIYWGVVAVAVGWIAFLSVDIAASPDPGVAARQQLAPSVQHSLRHNDSDSLSRYISSDDSDSLASSYLKKLRSTHYDALSVRLEGKAHDRLLVNARRNGESVGCTTWDVEKKDGRYLLDPAATVRQLACG